MIVSATFASAAPATTGTRPPAVSQTICTIRPDFSFLTGWESALVPMLLAGCNGGTHASSGVVPGLTRGIYDAVRAGQIDEAFAMQRKLTDLFDLMIQGADFPEGVRPAVELCGFRMGASRQPATESQLAERRRLAERIREKLDVLRG
ncbi:MAG: dihydrodipicolinate synthase family protein [Planctomycetia bacterium]